MRLVLATRNPGKVAELRARLAALPVELVTAAELGAPDVDETADSLSGNALLKARALCAHAGLPALADDTGLEVDALGGAPGVRSARFAGPNAAAAANRARLLADLDAARIAGDSRRSARFRTVLAFVRPAPAGAWGAHAETFEGVCEGTITMTERGDAGFGYDAVFDPADGDPPEVSPQDRRTFAQMSAEEKNGISHRGRALDAFVDWLTDVLNDPAEAL